MRELTYDDFMKLVRHSRVPIFNKITTTTEDGREETTITNDIVGYVCPYCEKEIYFDESMDKEVAVCECPNCHVRFVES